MSQWYPRKCVLVPIDFSERSWASLRTASQLVAEPTSLHVVYVLTALHPGDPGVVWESQDDTKRLKAVETSLKEHLEPLNLARAQVHACIGNPGHEIVDLAEQLGADLIVISTHGRTGVTRLMIGSVAERVVRHASCDVLVLRGAQRPDKLVLNV